MMNSKQAMISIVTINMNQGRFLPDALRSVQRQSHTNWQHIIVDPGSTDGSAEIYQDLRGDPRYLILEGPDDGPADGLNKGFARATGALFYYLNADDEVAPEAFAAVMRKVGPKLGAPVCILGHGKIIDELGETVRHARTTWTTPRKYVMGAGIAVQQATFFTPTAFALANGFNVNNKVCWDGELLLKMQLNGAQISIVDEVLGHFRIYEESITGSGKFRQSLSNEHDRMFREVMGRTRTSVDRFESLVRKVANRVHFGQRFKGSLN